MNKNMNKARINRNDEFYTQFSDIEKELKHYKYYFKNKIIYCNTDDYRYSNFAKYFIRNFYDMELQKIIFLDLSGNYFEYDGVTKQFFKFANGDFREQYSKEILRGVDIVVTNPPFSLFREYVEQLMEYDKDFLIIGNYNAITYKDIFRLFKKNKIWTGFSPRGMDFKTPLGEIKPVNAVWFTNIDIKKRRKPIILTKNYFDNEGKYPKYDNYNAIEVKRVADIPKDYKGIMGVPITFLNNYNPSQFDIICIDYEIANNPGKYEYIINKNWKGKIDRGYVNNKRKYSRVLIKHK